MVAFTGTRNRRRQSGEFGATTSADEVLAELHPAAVASGTLGHWETSAMLVEQAAR
jgi:hypothetical protein